MSGNNNNGNNGRFQSKMDQLGRKEKRVLPEVIKYGTYACFIIPFLFNLLYLTGAWTIKIEDGKMIPDTVDLMVRMGVGFISVVGIVFIWITHYLYEKES